MIWSHIHIGPRVTLQHAAYYICNTNKYIAHGQTAMYVWCGLAQLPSCICALWFCGGLRGSSFLTQERFFKKSWIMFRWSLVTSSVHILNIELKKSLLNPQIAISGNLHLWLGHLTCSKLIFYGRIGNFHISKIIFIISGEHYIKKSDF